MQHGQEQAVEGEELRHASAGGDLHSGPAGEEMCHVPAVEGEDLHHGSLSVGGVDVNCDDLQQQIVPAVAEAEELKENSEDVRKKTYLHGLNYLLWFEVGIEDWGGKVEFGFSDKHFEKRTI